ncbi:MAG: hypothetical protein Q4C12_00770 [Clostridia bacterium]|nr:hypothetical protein [Clostridia bacterium]
MEQRSHASRKRKKITVTGAAFFCALCLIAGYIAATMVAASTNSVDALRTQVAEKEAQIRDLSAALVTKEEEAAAAGRKIAELDTTREKLEAQVAQLEIEVDRVAGMAIGIEPSGVPAETHNDNGTSQWMRWLIVLCLATIFIISLAFAVSLLFKKDDRVEEDKPQKEKKSKKHSEKESTAKKATEYLLNGTLDEKLEALGGFVFGVTESSDGARSFGNTQNGAFAAFTEEGGRILTVIPKRIHFLVSELDEMGVNDLFRVRSTTEDGLGTGEIRIEDVVYTAQFEHSEDGWAMAARGDIYATPIDTVPAAEEEASEETEEEMALSESGMEE